MNEITVLLQETVNEKFRKAIISNRRGTCTDKKVMVKPFLKGNVLCFQFETFREKQVFHTNREKADTIVEINRLLSEDFKQMELTTERETITVLISKKGKTTIRRKQVERFYTAKDDEVFEQKFSHNRAKEYLLPAKGVPFLTELGITTAEGKVVDKKYKKYRQINRFLEFIRDVLPKLPKDKTLTIVDFGCGKSYLTFAMYYYLKILNGYQVRMIGLDLKEDVISHCNALAEKLKYHELTFLQGDISTYTGVNQVDMVVTLHACDTATDFALDKAIRWGATVILSVPCCQHEINRQITPDILQPVCKYGILKERMSALITDGLRANLLEQSGYDVQLLEFIDMEHTPKNILIRAVKQNLENVKGSENSRRKKEVLAYETLCSRMNLHTTLEKLLKKS